MDPELLGARIRLARERLGLSQTEFGALVAKDQRAISEYESGKRKIAATDLAAFARVLDVPILFFFEDALEVTDLDRAVLSEFQRIPTFEGKQAAIELLSLFADAIALHSTKLT